MAEEPMSFESFRKSFYYGAHSDMQTKFLLPLRNAANELGTLLPELRVPAADRRIVQHDLQGREAAGTKHGVGIPHLAFNVAVDTS